ncbi:hypothetical protein [Streptomyces noursei]|uniref:hypothetical protein n=1 Tax=Streptomyces noursei TaxID=1971 RepID=UPI00380CB9D2
MAAVEARRPAAPPAAAEPRALAARVQDRNTTLTRDFRRPTPATAAPRPAGPSTNATGMDRLRLRLTIASN